MQFAWFYVIPLTKNETVMMLLCCIIKHSINNLNELLLSILLMESDLLTTIHVGIFIPNCAAAFIQVLKGLDLLWVKYIFPLALT